MFLRLVSAELVPSVLLLFWSWRRGERLSTAPVSMSIWPRIARGSTRPPRFSPRGFFLFVYSIDEVVEDAAGLLDDLELRTGGSGRRVVGRGCR